MSLTAQQPYNNVVRTAVQALAAVLGGTQSLHTNALDEALALPTEAAATLALRTQQIIAHETGIVDVVDPLGRLVLRREADRRDRGRGAWHTSTRSIGWAAWSRRSSEGYPQKEIAESAYRFQQAVESKEQVIVGVNEFVSDDARGDRDAVHRRVGRRAAARAAGRRPVAGAIGARVERALDALAERREGRTRT